MKDEARILLVDDSRTLLISLTNVLTSAGYDVQAVSSGEAALATALATPPDLVLLDVRMDGMDGIEVCRHLKARKETQAIPIILISACADVEERVRGFELGAADYVQKPFQSAELLTRVGTQLALARTLRLLKDQRETAETANVRLQAEIEARRRAETEMRRTLERAERSRRALLSAMEDEKRARDELARTNSFLDSIIENIPDVLCLKDAHDLRIVRVNRAGEELLGLPRTQLLGKTSQQLFPKVQADFFEAMDRKVLESLQHVEVAEEPVLTPKGVRVGHTRKIPILDPEGQPAYVMGITVDITESKRARHEIEALSTRLEDILATVPEILMEIDSSQSYTWANEAGLSFFGEDVIGKPAHRYFVGEQTTCEAVRPIIEGREDTVYVESLQRRRDGEARLLAWCYRPVKDARGRIKGALSSARDITDSSQAANERRKLEEQLRVSQKMEAIGSLAGGVAHDFNNLLCVLLSYADFAIRAVKQGDPLKDDLLAVKRAGERAAALTRQLLAFSRKQVLQPLPISLNDVATGIEKMLRRILGEDIELVLALAPDLGVVRADQGQIEQVIMNLVVNARDAMPEGGRLTIQTANVDVNDDRVELRGSVRPGSYVELAVVDSGIGMDQQVKARVFEPFFTTKEVGKGTGLGLSTVYGIVKQSGGVIHVDSEVGRGTTFHILLPRERVTTAAGARGTAEEAASGGTETVLLVEDEEDLRRVARRSLEDAGYAVLSATDGEEALRVAAEYPGQIDLLLTDVVMPRMGGRALATQLSKARPKMAVLYMSGYTDDAILRHGVLESGIRLLAKPFTAPGLTREVRETLDAARDTQGDTEASGIPHASVALDTAALRRLPDTIVKELRRAAVAARFDDILRIVEEISGASPDVASALRDCVNRFDYVRIVHSVDSADLGRST